MPRGVLTANQVEAPQPMADTVDLVFFPQHMEDHHFCSPHYRLECMIVISGMPDLEPAVYNGTDFTVRQHVCRHSGRQTLLEHGDIIVGNDAVC